MFWLRHSKAQSKIARKGRKHLDWLIRDLTNSELHLTLSLLLDSASADREWRRSWRCPPRTVAGEGMSCMRDHCYVLLWWLLFYYSVIRRTRNDNNIWHRWPRGWANDTWTCQCLAARPNSAKSPIPTVISHMVMLSASLHINLVTYWPADYNVITAAFNWYGILIITTVDKWVDTQYFVVSNDRHDIDISTLAGTSTSHAIPRTYLS